MKSRILINCSNLHNGGAVAVATSVIDCLSRMDHEGLALSVILSTPVEKNLRELGTNLSAFKSCHTHNFYGIGALWHGLDRHFKGFDLVFTVFGPAYFVRRHARHIFGFAQPNILYPNNLLAAQLGFLERFFTLAKFELQAWFFSRADELVVELEHVKAGLMRRSMFFKKPIHVVYSSVHSIFSELSRWAPLALPEESGRLRLGVISRNYPHKNLAILADVKQHLLLNYGRDVDIFVTFRPEEWAACDPHFRNNIINVGELSLSQCPTFYAGMDGVIFPSLLECFSAVPIETLMLRRPLFASNLSFIKDVCGEYCQYFDPLNVADIARSIDAYFCRSLVEQQRLCEIAYAHVQRYPGPMERAGQYLKIIRNALT